MSELAGLQVDVGDVELEGASEDSQQFGAAGSLSSSGSHLMKPALLRARAEALPPAEGR